MSLQAPGASLVHTCFFPAMSGGVARVDAYFESVCACAGVPLRVSLVSPGLVHTDFFSAMSGGDAATIDRYQQQPGLTAADIAQSVLYALAAPDHVEVNDILVRPTGQKA
jgi:NADP-dependent 3-hydroxy acid dehydrogenase YdfG